MSIATFCLRIASSAPASISSRQRGTSPAATTRFTACAAACESGLASDPAPDIATALTRGLASTTPDVTLLQRWLLDHQTHTGLPVDPTLRWLAIVRLSRLGALDARAIDDERVGDGTITGVLGAAKALAAMPTEQAKAAAWQRLLEPDISNRAFESTAAGLWDMERPDLSYPYVEAYLAEAPALAQRGQAFAGAVGDAFPAVWLPDPAVEAFARALEGDLPTVLRRKWEDTYDDLVRSRPSGQTLGMPIEHRRH